MSVPSRSRHASATARHLELLRNVCIACALAVVAACGQQIEAGAGAADAPDVYSIALTVPTVAALPKCTQSLGGTTAQVSSPLGLWSCIANKWISIPCTRAQGGLVAYDSTSQALLACVTGAWTLVPTATGAQGATGPQGPKGDPGGPGTLVKVASEPAGAHCPAAGQRIDVGIDQDRNGALSGSEVTSTHYVCNGVDGTQGPAGPAGQNGSSGSDGLSSLVATLAEPEGSNCTRGGQKLSFGLDRDRDAVLDASEISSVAYVCNAEPAPSQDAGAPDAGSSDTTRSCYEGPAATLGIGPCRAGSSRLGSSGVWGPCEGQVLPVTEVCGDQLDNDCSGAIDDDRDIDGDGWSACGGDCCEIAAPGCSDPARVNPGAIDLLRAGTQGYGDDDCSGVPGDSASANCDVGLALADTSETSAAAALDLCRTTDASARTWGVISSRYVTANGLPLSPGLQVGLQSNFGSNVSPTRGSRMLLLSTGTARTPNQPGYCSVSAQTLQCGAARPGTAPSGFPREDEPACHPSPEIFDDVALELRLRAPTNAIAFEFDFKFYVSEYPHSGCSDYNDQFITLVSPTPGGSGPTNVSFDVFGNTVAVNGYLDVCQGCSGGIGQLAGTGFESHAATSWWTSAVPVTGGQELTIRFAIWNGGDGTLDSSVLLDGFRWSH